MLLVLRRRRLVLRRRLLVRWRRPSRPRVRHLQHGQQVARVDCAGDAIEVELIVPEMSSKPQSKQKDPARLCRRTERAWVPEGRVLCLPGGQLLLHELLDEVLVDHSLTLGTGQNFLAYSGPAVSVSVSLAASTRNVCIRVLSKPGDSHPASETATSPGCSHCWETAWLIASCACSASSRRAG